MELMTMPDYPHLDCTTTRRREQICREYDVTVNACIYLYGGRTVRSDANNRLICDKFYRFFCVKHADQTQKYIIECGGGAARHLCSLINQPIPCGYNPFIEESITNIGDNDNEITNMEDKEGNDDINSVVWNEERRLLYRTVQLFIVRYQSVLYSRASIFEISKSLEARRNLAPQDFHYRNFSAFVTKFHTTIPIVIEQLEKYGSLHAIDLEPLAQRIDEIPGVENIFR